MGVDDWTDTGQDWDTTRTAGEFNSVTEPKELKEVIAGIPGTTLAAKLRPLWADIERRISEGVTHEAIVQALNENGFNLSLETFRKNLYRNRARVQKNGTAPEPINREPKPVVVADGNSQLAEAEQEEEDATGTPSLEDILDPRKRDKLGESYLNRKKPILKKTRE